MLQVRNADGLIYIDIELPKEKNAKQQRPVIHGAENKTVYEEVAYGQVGDRLPESDQQPV